MSTPSLIERSQLGQINQSIHRNQSIKKVKIRKKKVNFEKLTTLTKSWKVMADVRLGRSSSWWPPPPLQPLLLSSCSLSSCCCRWNFSSSCWILCGSMCWRNSGDRRARPKSSHGISPKPSGSNCVEFETKNQNWQFFKWLTIQDEKVNERVRSLSFATFTDRNHFTPCSCIFFQPNTNYIRLLKNKFFLFLHMSICIFFPRPPSPPPPVTRCWTR